MNWEQKLSALQSLTDTSLRMRKPGDWYVIAYGRSVVESGGAILAGSYGNGTTPEEAVHDDFRLIAESHAPLKVGDAYWQWSGFMWKSISRELACILASKEPKP